MEDEIRRRAYELWEQYGRPDSGEEEFWLKAEREIKQAKGLDRTIPEPSKTASDRQEKASPRKKTTLAILLTGWHWIDPLVSLTAIAKLVVNREAVAAA